jgi:hypothetical protein
LVKSDGAASAACRNAAARAAISSRIAATISAPRNSTKKNREPARADWLAGF